MKRGQPNSYVSSRNGLYQQDKVFPAVDNMGERTVFRNVMKVVPSDDDCTGHFCRHDFASQNTTTDRDVASKWTLLV